MKPSNILSCLEKVDEKYILEAAPAAYRPEAPGKVRKGISRKILIAAAVLVLIPVVAFAATKGFGLLDYLSDKGVKNPDQLADLSSGPQEIFSDSDVSAEIADNGVWFTAGKAKFSVMESLYDGETLYLLAKVIPAEDDVFLIPQYFGRQDSTKQLVGLDEIPEGTIEQYAGYLGKGLGVGSIGYSVNGSHLDGSEDYIYGPDGALYYYFTGMLPSDGNVTIDCTGVFYQDLEEATDKQTVVFSINLREASETKVIAYGSFDNDIQKDTGVTVRTLTIEETDLGYYATFEFLLEGSEDISFLLTDKDGNTLPAIPGAPGTGLKSLGDGVYTTTVTCLTPEDASDVRFMIYDFVEGIKYGPYRYN